MAYGSIEQAESAGRAAFGEIGARCLPQLQIQAILGAQKRLGYDDNPYARVRRHIWIMGPPSTRKSTLAKVFLKEIMEGVTVPERASLHGKGGPIYHPMTGQDTTYERLRGSVDLQGNVIPPLLQSIDYLFYSEIPSALGHDIKTMLERADTLGVILEEGLLSTALVKTAGQDARESIEKAKDKLDALKMRVDPESGIMEFDVRVNAIACSRFLDTEEESALVKSGFLDRWFVCNHNPTEAEYRSTLTGPLRPLPDWEKKQLRDFNGKLRQTRFGFIPLPPPSIMGEVKQRHAAILDQIQNALGGDSRKYLTLRDILDHTRIVTARAIERTIQAIPPEEYEQNEKVDIPKLEYKEEDAEWAARFISRNHLQDLYSAQLRIAMHDPTREEDEQVALDFWQTHIEHPTMTRFTARDFNDWFVSTGKKDLRAGYRKLYLLIKRGWIVNGDDIGEYRLSGRFRDEYLHHVFPEEAENRLNNAGVPA